MSLKEISNTGKLALKPALHGNLRLLFTIENTFLHLMIFSDAFKTSRQSKNKGLEVIFFSTVEYEPNEFWDHVNQASVAPLVVYNKANKSYMGPNQILNLFNEGFSNLAKGIDVGNLRVFGYLTIVLGDMPGRCELGINLND
jgi:hypothetical protein